MKIKAAVFDMDGTLIDSLMLWDITWETFGARYLNGKKFIPRPEDDKRFRTLTLAESMDLLHSKYGLGKNGSELLDIANELTLNFYQNEVKLKPGALEFLSYCKANGTKMCIASATAPHLIDAAVEHCGIKKYFEDILSCADIGKGKEEPDVFLLACKALGQAPSETWLFEDSLTAIETATRIGMKTVGVYDAYNFGQECIKKTADVYIAKGESLAKLIDR